MTGDSSITMVTARELNAFRQESSQPGTFNPKQREKLLKPYLPPPPATSHTRQHQLSHPIRNFLRSQVHVLLYAIIHTIFSLYIRLRQTYHALVDRIFAILYYHHRAPELIKQDVRSLTKIPEHLSVILELQGEERGSAGLDGLLDEVAEISAWCVCVGIPMLSIYEKTGKQFCFPQRSLDCSSILRLFRDFEAIPPRHPSDCLF